MTKLQERLRELQPLISKLDTACKDASTSDCLVAFGRLLGRWCYAAGQEEGPLIEVIRVSSVFEQIRLLKNQAEATKQ